jgi:hypothetical protein
MGTSQVEGKCLICGKMGLNDSYSFNPQIIKFPSVLCERHSKVWKMTCYAEKEKFDKRWLNGRGLETFPMDYTRQYWKAWNSRLEELIRTEILPYIIISERETVTFT